MRSELCDGGAGIVVTDDNVDEYACLLAEHLLCGGLRDELGALLRGFWAVCPLGALVASGVSSYDVSALSTPRAHKQPPPLRAQPAPRALCPS